MLPVFIRPIAGVMAVLCASCAAPDAKLPELPRDAVLAEQRRQQVAQIRKHYSELHRVDTVAFRIRTANAADCKDRVAAQIGLFAATARSLPRRYQSYAAEALGVGWTRPTAISVVEGSPAAAAGIQAGDEVLTLNGEAIPAEGTARWMTRRLTANGTEPVDINTRRAGADRTVTVTPVMGCSIPVNYRADPVPNASASDHQIIINSGFVAIAQSDAELAMVVGHELGHSTLGHLDKQRWNTLLGQVAGAAIDVGILAGGVSTGGAFRRQFGILGALAYSVGFEREADYVGAYYAARAGYDIRGTEDIWRKIGLLNPSSISSGRTHPVTPVRFVQIQKVTAEIEEKRRLGLPLIPELRHVADTAEAAPPAVDPAARH